MNRTDRLFALVEELRAHAPRPRTVAQLANRFEVTVRTIQRDLLALQEAGIPLWSSPGPGGGYHLDVTMTLPPINFSAREAMALVVALSTTESSPFASSARTAMQKVSAAMAADTAAEVDALAVRIRRVPQQRGGSPREAIEEAVLSNIVTVITYADTHGTTTTRAIEPHSLVFGRGQWHLIAWCRLRHEGRGFRLDRITDATLTDERCPERSFAEVAGDLVDLARPIREP